MQVLASSSGEAKEDNAQREYYLGKTLTNKEAGILKMLGYGHGGPTSFWKNQLLRSAAAGRKKDVSSKRNQKSFDFLSISADP